MKDPEESWAYILLYVVGPLKPEQAPAILNAAARTVRELSVRQDGIHRIFTDDIRLQLLAYYCEEHGLPYEPHSVSVITFSEDKARRYGYLPKDGEPCTDIFCDPRIPASFFALPGCALYLFYDGSLPAVCEQALAIRQVCEDEGCRSILVPI